MNLYGRHMEKVLLLEWMLLSSSFLSKVDFLDAKTETLLSQCERGGSVQLRNLRTSFQASVNASSFTKKPDQNRLIHTVRPCSVASAYSGTLPSPLSFLVLCVSETHEENIKMSWEGNAVGSLRT